jgi:L-malate glycosyltransferase
MRIAYFADGRYVHTHKWMRFFNERGHEVHLISFAPLDQQHLAAVAATGAKYHGEIGLLHLKRFWHTLAAHRKLKSFLRSQKIDVLHCHFLGANAWYGALSRFHPFVITVMGGDILGPDWQPSGDIRERKLTPFALRQADLVTCWSKTLTTVVRRYTRPRTPVEVIHGGIDLSRFSPGPDPTYLRERYGIPAGAKVILSPRLMRPLYNLDTIVASADRVWNDFPDARFLFAVLPEAKDPDYEAQVLSVTQASKKPDQIKFIGGIAHNEMADHYRLADVTVSIPSSDGTPMSVLESMACGTPVVVSNIRDYDTQYIELDRTVLAADPRNADDVASALKRFLRDEEFTKQISTEARRRVVETASYESQMARMEELYKELVKHG